MNYLVPPFVFSTNFHFTTNLFYRLKPSISRAGFGWSEEEIIVFFLIVGEGIVEVNIELVHLNKVASTSEVEAYLEANGLRVATFKEILAFGEKYHDVQREFPVVAIGSSWVHPRGFRHVPYLDRRGSERGLCLFWYVLDWFEVCRFLAVRK